jgi:hypothetical protein
VARATVLRCPWSSAFQRRKLPCQPAHEKNPVDAKDFWTYLEYRVCREIDGLRIGQFRGLWCDGFIPEQFELKQGQPVITGRVWMARGGRHQEQWRFTLVLAPGIASEANVDWATMLPAEDVTGWLSIDPNERELSLDPAAAYRDGPTPAPDMNDLNRYSYPVTAEAIEALCARFDLPDRSDDQDWEFTSADASRLQEFLAALEGNDLSDPERFTLSQIVMQSFNDLMDNSRAKPPNWDRFAALLRARPKLHAHALCYWASLESTLENAFYVSSLVRPLWAELQPLIDAPDPTHAARPGSG